jgi:hypothetical protein
MFEVRKYEPPHIFVTDRGTGETYKLFVGSDGALTRDEARFNQGDMRRTAIAYLAQRARVKVGVFVEEHPYR